jgi:hypothetical protein
MFKMKCIYSRPMLVSLMQKRRERSDTFLREIK